jgi:ATP-dependent exoDNAse (exonuclease V) beta subunit
VSAVVEPVETPVSTLNDDTKNYFKLVSDEAFKLSSSSAVCLIIDALRCLSNYKDDLVFAQLAFTYQSQKNPKFSENLTDFFDSYRLNVETRLIASLPKRPFQEFLPEIFIREFRTLQKLPLYELVEKIIAIFGLSEQKNQHAFLYDFLDCVNMFVADTGRNKACLVSTFIEFWNDELQNKTITINAHIPGVRILTIHKSKGLEFHTVVVPFCEWAMDETKFEQLVWHESKNNKNWFEQMPLIPLNYGKTLKHSHFSTDFENETLKLWVDNLNLLYVALTRPKHNLLVLADALPKKSDKLRVSNLLHNFTDGNLVSSVETLHAMSLQNDDGNVFKMPLKNIEIPFSVAQKPSTFYLSKEAIKWYSEMENATNEQPM